MSAFLQLPFKALNQVPTKMKTQNIRFVLNFTLMIDKGTCIELLKYEIKFQVMNSSNTLIGIVYYVFKNGSTTDFSVFDTIANQ